MGQQPSRHVGSASRSLSGNHANKVVFNGSPSEYSGPQSAKPGLFSVGEPASVFQGTAGVVAGTDNFVVRRWNGKGGGRRWGPGFQVAGAVSSGKVLGPVSGYVESDSGNMQFCGAFVAPFGSETDPHVTVVPPGVETEPNGAQVHGAAASPVAIETDLENAQFDGAVASPSGFETELKDAQFDDTVASPSGFETEVKFAQCCDAGAKSGFKTPRSRGSMVASSGPLRCVDPGKGDAGHLSRQRKGRAAVGAGACKQTRAEAGSTCLDDLFVSCRVEDPSSRVARVNTALHDLCLVHSSFIPAQNSHARMHHARCVVNSVGDTEDGGRLSCVPGETKSPSTSTRSGVRRSAVYESAHTQQTPLKMHVETWAGLLRNQGLKIFRQVEIVPGCAVVVACPSCPDYSPEPPGQGRIIRNMLGWSQLGKTVRSGVWLFRGALQGVMFSSLAVAGDWKRKGLYYTVWAVFCDSSCTCSYAYGRGPAIGPHTGKQCWPLLAGVWRAIAPLMKPWCAEGVLPTAANLNLYRGRFSRVASKLHCFNEFRYTGALQVEGHDLSGQ